mmetsp:Transcript_54723/g.97188  ORF Transcript_54723/g.97188 Transcript_54723/m.97188 type:complete len:206 (+) Transcript_54723:62-679(+)
MSKIIFLPKAVLVATSTINGSHFLRVTGKLGSLETALPAHLKVLISAEPDTSATPGDSLTRYMKVAESGTDSGYRARKKTKAAMGLLQALLQNMVTGVTTGFRKTLLLTGVGYRAELLAPNASQTDAEVLRLSVGYSHPVDLPVPEGLSVTLENPTTIEVFGICANSVGEFAATLRKVRPPEPYKGKGISYSGELLRRSIAKSNK